MQIQRLQQNIVQLYRQVGPTKIFEETNQFKVCVNKNEYIPIVVQPHANSEKRRVEVIYTDSCQLPYTRRMLGISSEKELELNRRKPGKGTSFKSELLITDTDLTLESIHKRCRSRKASLQALYDEHVTLGTFLQHSTCADFKLLIKTLLIAITDPKHLLQFSQDFPSEVNIILTKLKKQLINGVLMSKEFLEELESRPNMQQRAGAGGNICEALQENCGIRADRVVTLYGSPYHPNTFAPLHSNQVKRFFVSSQLGNKCKAYHSLHHYKYYLFEKCKEKYNKVKRPRFSNPLKFDAKSHCYPSNSDGGNFKDVEPSADPKKHVWTSSNEKVQQIKSKTEIESVLGSSVLECLDDAEWINKLYNHWIGIYTWVSQLLQEEK
uniref:Uncharacterized protein n=1 Tax=Ciona savignyi TaxID=51511 RepID=H2YQ91_CIOSA